jgi:hypothetical protein
MKFAALPAVATLTVCGSTAAAELVIPKHVQLPDLVPLVSSCSDPAADRFMEIDISQRPPAGATRVQRVGGWVTSDGVYHWPFVVRIRNIGDQPFIGKPGQQDAVVTEDDRVAGTKGRVVASVPFDRIAQHSGLAVRFTFTAPTTQVEQGKFRRVYTLSLNYKNQGYELINGRNGDCNLRNNTFTVEFDGSRKGWIFAK